MPDAETPAVPLPTAELLAELGRRYRVKFGRIEVVFHDGRPSPRLLVEHRLQQAVDDPRR